MKEKKKKNKRELKGVIISDKMEKTVVVRVERAFLHPKYKKVMRVRKNYKADDKDNSYKIGDKVIIRESRPISKEKKWVVIGKIMAEKTKE